MVLAHATGRWVARRTTSAREANADLTSAIQEHLAGIRVLRLFGRVSASVERIAELSRRFADGNLSLARLKGGLQPIYTTLMIAGVVLIVWKGSERVVAGAHDRRRSSSRTSSCFFASSTAVIAFRSS